MISLKKLKEDLVYPDAKVVKFGDEVLFVKQYLPSGDKYVLIKALVGSLDLDTTPFEPYLSEMLFEVRVILAYSNLDEGNSDEEESMNVFEQYDVLESNGLIDLVIGNIPVKEYEELVRLYEESIKAAIAFNANVSSLLFRIIPMIQDLFPALNSELENFDPEKINLLTDSLEKINQQINTTQ